MTRRIGLALTLHNHQPVGNFGWVIAETYERAYLPMLGALERHPAVHLALHYSGPLLAWIRAERPEFLDRLRALVARGQVEIVGGGWYEPVLASLPERDRMAQLRRMADELELEFGRRPVGAWLAERVWEPNLPTALAATGYRWTILDDAHFRAAAIPEDALWGPYTTEDQGADVTVFGTEQGLRYRVPFGPVAAVIEHLRDHATEAGDRVGTMGDDGEKFGGWPTTFEHCWTNGWVDEFFSALDANADWLETITPTQWLDGHSPIGRVSIPTGSYAEMGVWALPPDEAVAYSTALQRAEEEGRPDVRWLRGAIWRNFQVRYREINDLHKQMLRASSLVDAMSGGAEREKALDHLLAGQSNDPYWHGLFGGIYVPDLRLANHANLIAAEDIALGAGDPPSGLEIDLDLDGRAEVLLANHGQIVAVTPDAGGGIGRWDLRAARFALAAVLRRRPEAYHEKVRTIDAERNGLRDATPAGAVASIHDLVQAKHAGLSSRLQYDRDERRSGLVRFLARDAAPDPLAAGDADLADLASGGWTIAQLTAEEVVLEAEGAVRVGDDRWPVAATKAVRIGGGRLDPLLSVEVTLTNRGSAPLTGRLAIEWSTMLLGGGGNPAAWQEIGGRRAAHDATLSGEDATVMAAGNDHLGIRVDTTIDPPATIWTAPIETVSNSEAGFELVYQGSAALISRLVTVASGESATIAVRHQVVLMTDLRSVDPAAATGTLAPMTRG